MTIIITVNIIIGPKGAVIQSMKDQSGAYIEVRETRHLNKKTDKQ